MVWFQAVWKMVKENDEWSAEATCAQVVVLIEAHVESSLEPNHLSSIEENGARENKDQAAVLLCPTTCRKRVYG